MASGSVPPGAEFTPLAADVLHSPLDLWPVPPLPPLFLRFLLLELELGVVSVKCWATIMFTARLAIAAVDDSSFAFGGTAALQP